MPTPGPVLSKSVLVTFCGDKGLTRRALDILLTSQNPVFSRIVFNAGEHTALALWLFLCNKVGSFPGAHHL